MMDSSLSYRMQIRWNRKTTDWFRRASEYTGFHEKLSEILLAMMPEAETVCDLGCGAGMIDFYLKDHMKQVTCIDQVPEVISILREEIREKSIGNMQAFCGDIRQAEGLWDTCIMLFVGAAPEDIGRYLHLCRDRLLIVDRGGCRESLAKGEKKRPYHSLLPLINKYLSSDIRCTLTDYTLEYGQPLRSIEEAYDYVSLYHKNPENMNVLDYIYENVERTNDIRSPYYLPYQKTFGIIEVKREENLHLLQ